MGISVHKFRRERKPFKMFSENQLNPNLEPFIPTSEFEDGLSLSGRASAVSGQEGV